MNKVDDKNAKLREISAIGVKKACLMAIAQELDKFIKTDDIILLRDLKVHLLFNDFDKAEHLKIILCHKYDSLQKIKSGAKLLADKLGVSLQTIINWKSGNVLITPIMAKRLQTLLAISASELRPDLFDATI